MASTPTHKNLSALIEQPDSGAIESGDTRTVTKVYMATYEVCKAAVKTKGTLGTGSDSSGLAGYVLKKSSVTKSEGEQGKLVDIWEAGGADGNPELTPLPPDEFDLVGVDLNPSVEKNHGFRHAIAYATRYNKAGVAGTTIEHKSLLAWVRQAGLLVDGDNASEVAYQALNNIYAADPTEVAKQEALVLADLLRRGIGNFYAASLEYVWTQYSFFKPSFSRGGEIEVPGGPLADGIAALNLSCLRRADGLHFNGSIYSLTRKWSCCFFISGYDYWEPVLYDIV